MIDHVQRPSENMKIPPPKEQTSNRAWDDVSSDIESSMPIIAKKLATPTLRHRIVQEVRQAILNGSLQPGERFVERDLAARLGTSLTSAREAIIQLESEGLITKRPNSTTHVTELSQAEISQIFALRKVLEEYAFVEAARHATPAEMAELSAIHQGALRSAKAGDARGYIEQDLAWHEAVWRMSHNPYLHESLKRAMLPLFGFSIIGVAMSEGFNLLEDARSHQPLLEAVKIRDLVAVRKAYRAAASSWRVATSQGSELLPGEGLMTDTNTKSRPKQNSVRPHSQTASTL